MKFPLRLASRLTTWTLLLVSASLLTHSLVTCSDSNAAAQQHPLTTGHANAEKFEFQAEVNRMMKLIIHSLYKSKEIFLRELISNASDALDKIRVVSLTNLSLLDAAPTLNITVRADPERKQLIITDTGIGMTKKDLIKNLGTLAKSGTADFLKALESQSADSNLIGQFGVGFYSAFLVADTVTVISKHNDDKQYIWESHAESDFSVEEDPRGNTLGRGTQIILYLKPEDEEFLLESQLEDIIRKYSEFITFPIYLQTNQTVTEDVPLTEEELAEAEAERAKNMPAKEEKTEDESAEEKPADDAEDEDKLQVEEVDESKEEPAELPPIKTTKSVEKHVLEWQKMNPNRPLWTRDTKNVTEEEYHDFYKAFSRDSSDPMAYSHFRAEGDIDFKSLLYIPAKADANQLQSQEAHIRSIKLFVRRVFITDELLDFIPKYLGFLKGMVDSDDLPLNVSRETLQQHRLLKNIRRKVITKALDLIKSLAKNETKYEEFLKQYSTNLKLGVIEDVKNRKKLMKLLRFHSSHSDDKRTSLEDYVGRMKKKQKQIYFLTGPNLEEIKKSPFVEVVEARGYEVLYMEEPIDEYVLQSVRDFDRHPFQNVAKDGLKFGDESAAVKEKREALAEKFKPLADYLSTVLEKWVEKVEVSHRLTTSPCAIVASQHGWSGNMERLMTSQALGKQDDPMRAYMATLKKKFEINPRHPLMESLLEKVEASELDKVDEVARLLYEVTSLRSGYSVKDSVEFANLVERAIRLNLGVDVDAQAVVEDIEAAEDKEPGAADDDDLDVGGEDMPEVTMDDADFEHDEL